MQANQLRLFAVTVSGSLYGICPEAQGGVDYKLVNISNEKARLPAGYGRGMVGLGKFLFTFGSGMISLLKDNPFEFWESNQRIGRTSAVVAVFLDEARAREEHGAMSNDAKEVRFAKMDKYRAETLAALRACSNHPAIVINEEYWEIIFREKL